MKRLLCRVIGHKWDGTCRDSDSCVQAMTCARCGKQTTVTEHVNRQETDAANPCHTTLVCTRCGAREEQWAHDFHWSFQDERVCLKECRRCGLRTEESHESGEMREHVEPDVTELWYTCRKCGGGYLGDTYRTMP